MVVMAKRAAVDLQSLAVDPLVLFPGGISVLLRAVGNLPRASFAMLLKFRGHALLVFVLLCLVLIVGHPAGERSQLCAFTQPLQRYRQYLLDSAETLHQFIARGERRFRFELFQNGTNPVLNHRLELRRGRDQILRQKNLPTRARRGERGGDLKKRRYWGIGCDGFSVSACRHGLAWFRDSFPLDLRRVSSSGGWRLRPLWRTRFSLRAGAGLLRLSSLMHIDLPQD